MPLIRLELIIDAPIERVFDLSRSIELHQISTAGSKETAIAGRTSGLISLGESVTWRAKHFGIYQTLTSIITTFNRPFSFTDEQKKGIFESFTHRHLFSKEGNSTRLVDEFNYTAPLGILGKVADLLFLKKYMTRLLKNRNRVIKEYAETGKWLAVLPK